jgi:hypothetical protein
MQYRISDGGGGLAFQDRLGTRFGLWDLDSALKP